MILDDLCTEYLRIGKNNFSGYVSQRTDISDGTKIYFRPRRSAFYLHNSVIYIPFVFKGHTIILKDAI